MGSGLAVFGPQDEIDQYVARLTQVGGTSPRARRAVLDLTQAGSVLGALTSSSGEYVQLSKQTLQQLQQHAQNVKPSGWSSGVIRDLDGSILSHIEWKPADFAPQQFLALQQLATMAALRIAVQEVTDAVERVEGKLDVVSDLVRSETIGNAIGDYRFLADHVERLDQGEVLSDTDWSTVASMGAAITRDIERLRAYVRLRLADERERSSTWSRAERAEDLAASHFDQILGALLLSEHNLLTWQRLRVARHQGGDADRLTEAMRSAGRVLEQQRESDQQLVSELEQEINDLTAARGLEGLALTKRGQLLEDSARVMADVTWFADKRNLDISAESAELPGLRQSARELRRRVVSGGREAKRLAVSRVRPPPAPLELGQASAESEEQKAEED